MTASGGRGLAVAATVVLGLAGPARAVDVDGVYALTPDEGCPDAGSRGKGLRVEKGVLYGVESQCRMVNEVPIRNMDASLFDMMCFGEGTEWVERAVVMRGSEGQLILVWNGYAFAYPRCADIPAAPATSIRPRARP